MYMITRWAAENAVQRL